MFFDKLCYIHDNFDRFHDYRIKMLDYMSTYHNFQKNNAYDILGEKNVYRESVKMLSKCKIFEIQHRRPIGGYLDEITEGLKDFFLPFSDIAIEKSNCCIILSDSDHEQVGYDKPRYYLAMFDSERKTYEGEHIYLIAMGVVDGISFEDDTIVSIHEQGIFCLYTMEKGVYHPTEQWGDVIYDNVVKTLRNDLLLTFVDLAYINIPSNFILETSQVKKKNRKKQKKIVRSSERPVYTILSPGQIRRKIGLPSVKGTGTKAPHERRKHTRFLSDERYSEKGKIKPMPIPMGARKGQPYYKKINVPPTWIGPSEKVDGNKRYKVILDR